jgi:hypothetical protein
MKERPILFSGPMIRALLSGTKTQTRRVLNPLLHLIVDGDEDTGRVVEQSDADFGRLAMEYVRCPYGAVGDRLWVREAFCTLPGTRMRHVYRADVNEAPAPGGLIWTPSIFMRRATSRLTLEITDVRVERLQSISAEDARAEGVPLGEQVPATINGEPGTVAFFDPLAAFAYLWDALNGKRAPWASNPWVWALTFKRVDGRAERGAA